MAAWTRTLTVSSLAALTLLLVTARVAAASAPTPDEQARAHALNALGFEAAEEGRFEEAARAFDQAWELDPHPDLMWSAARAWQKAGALTKARERYRRYLTYDDLPPDQRLQANDNLVVIDRALREHAERVGRRAGAALGRLEPRWVAWATPPAPPDPPPEEPRTSPERPRRVGWILVGAGVAVGAAGGLFYALAADDRDELAGFPDQVGPGDHAEYEDTRERFLRHRALMWTSVGLAAGAVAGGLAALLVGRDAATETRGSAGTLGVTPTRGGASVTGAWRF